MLGILPTDNIDIFQTRERFSHEWLWWQLLTLRSKLLPMEGETNDLCENQYMASHEASIPAKYEKMSAEWVVALEFAMDLINANQDVLKALCKQANSTLWDASSQAKQDCE